MPEQNSTLELWHYTDIENCFNILISQELWFSDFLDTNDSTDGEWVQRILKDYFREPLKQAFLNNPGSKKFLRSIGNPDSMIEGELERRLAIVFGALLNKADPDAAFKGYLFCFSHESSRHKEDGLLSMWRGYGREQPVALVFDEAKLEKILLPQFKSGIGWFNHPAIYAMSHNDLPEEVKTCLTQMMPLMTRLVIDQNTPPKILNECFQGVGPLIARIKHGGFEEEKEYRMVAITPNHRRKYTHVPEMEDLKKHFNVGQDGIGKYRLKVNLNADMYDALVKVVIGPCHNQQQIHDRLRALKNRLHIKLKITRSSIPFVQNRALRIPDNMTHGRFEPEIA